MTWWDWDRDFDETAGTVICHSGYSFGTEDCGLIIRRDDVLEWDAADDGIPFTTAVEEVRYSDVTFCGGDSGGSVWRQQTNGHRNLTGIVHAANQSYLLEREGEDVVCGNGYHTHIRSAYEMGLSAPWGMVVE